MTLLKIIEKASIKTKSSFIAIISVAFILFSTSVTLELNVVVYK